MNDLKEKIISDYKEKLEIYTKNIEKENELSAYNNRGNIYFLLGEYEKALNDYTEIIKRNKNDKIAYFNRANTYFKLKDYDKALIDYQKAVEIDRKYEKALFQQGKIFCIKKNTEKAKNIFKEILELNPNNLLVNTYLKELEKLEKKKVIKKSKEKELEL